MTVSALLPRAALLAAGLLLTTGAAALKIQRYDVDGLLARADAVVVVRVDAQTRRPGRGGIVWTDYTVSVEERLAGRDRGRRLTLGFAGLTGTGVQLLHAPSLTVGSRYVLFLQPDRPYPVPTVGWGQGIFRIDGRSGELRSAEGQPLQRDDDGALALGAAAPPRDLTRRAGEPRVFDADGAPVGAPQRAAAAAAAPSRRRPAHAATLDDLRGFISARRAAP